MELIAEESLCKAIRPIRTVITLLNRRGTVSNGWPLHRFNVMCVAHLRHNKMNRAISGEGLAKTRRLKKQAFRPSENARKCQKPLDSSPKFMKRPSSWKLYNWWDHIQHWGGIESAYVFHPIGHKAQTVIEVMLHAHWVDIACDINLCLSSSPSSMIPWMFPGPHHKGAQYHTGAVPLTENKDGSKGLCCFKFGLQLLSSQTTVLWTV